MGAIMDDTMTDDKTGFFSRIKGFFSDRNDYEEEPEQTDAQIPTGQATKPKMRQEYRYNVCVRTEIVSFDDAMAAANGMKSGHQQILNLSKTEPVLRQRIIDFLTGVNFAEGGTLETIGENIFVIVPATAFVEMLQPVPRMNATRN